MTKAGEYVLLTRDLSATISTMIAHVWRARAAAQFAPLYIAHFNDEVLPRLKALPGYRGAYLLERSSDGEVDFTVQTLWDSMDAIKGFAEAVTSTTRN
jgi:heme-degrading monooxygenase HmoA